MKQQTIPEIQAMIMNMDNDEINSIVETIRFRRKQLSSEAKKKFKVGDKVYFVSRKVGKIYGTVEKINRKNILVDQTNGMQSWNVSPTFLTLDK